MQAGDVVSLRVSTSMGPTEVVGTLVAAAADSLSVRRRDGSVVEIATADVLAGRVVPPPPSASVDVGELQRIMAAGWRAFETEPLGDWLLRAGGGFTRRANSALVVGSPGLPLDVAVGRVEQWYAARGLPGQLQVPAARAAELAAVVGSRGWTVGTLTHVMTAEAAHVVRGRGSDVEVRLDPAPDEEWLGLYRRGEGGLPAAAAQVLTHHPDVVFASIREREQCVAIARAAVDGRWAGLFAVEVDPARRRNGLGAAVSIAAIKWAVGRGARRVYLQVQRDNTAAVRLYEQLGFAHHHDYVYWTCQDEHAASCA